jgi:hypothetical protein
MVSKVKIMGHEYKINYIHDNEFTTGKIASCDTKYCQIYIIDSLPESVAGVAILHEAMHTIDDYLKLNLDEQQITAISSSIYGFLKDNGIEIKF